MPRKDIYHDSVKVALEKDGWRTIDNPFRIVAGGIVLGFLPERDRAYSGFAVA